MVPRRSKVQQAYGYAVCLVCIIAVLFTLVNVLHGALDLAHPDASPRFGFMASAQTFDDYRLQRSQRIVAPGQPAQPATPDSVLRRVYDEERAAALATAHWEALKSFVTNLILLIVAIGLFAAHWRWLRDGTDIPAVDSSLQA